MITDALLSELLEAWDHAIAWDDKRLGNAITTLRAELEGKPSNEIAYHYHRRVTDVAPSSCPERDLPPGSRANGPRTEGDQIELANG